MRQLLVAGALIAGTGSFFAAYHATPLQAAEPIFENLGKPVQIALPIEFVTRGAQGRAIAWGDLKDATRRALIGVRVDTGEVITVDLLKFGLAAANQLFKFDENTIYIYSGNPGRFFKYLVDKNQLTEIETGSKAAYWMKGSSAKAPDGKIYVGTFPDASVSILDTKADKARVLPRVTPDKQLQYVNNPAVSDDNIAYFPAGMHHAEIWSYDPKTEATQQILTPELIKAYGSPKIWTGTDGQVYGTIGSTNFLCRPDDVEIGKTQPPRAKTIDNVVDGKMVEEIDTQGRLVIEDVKTKKETLVPTKFENASYQIFSIGDVHDGKLYGSTIKPGHTFTYDITTGQTADLGLLSRGRIQVYDFLSYGKGVYLGSYTGGNIDFYDPAQPRETGKNPVPVVALTPKYRQERPFQLTLGPDGKIYTVTAPVKGHLGGALVSIDPRDNSSKVWRNVIENQSETSVVAVPETNEVFVTSSVGGGSSAVPTEKEGVVFLWDTKQEKIAFQAKPIPGARTYAKAVRARNGIIYGFAGQKYYALDPVKRQTIFTGDLPGVADASPNGKPPLLCDAPVGARGLIYGVDTGRGAIIAIDPANHEARIVAKDSSLKGASAVNATEDGYIYYGTGPSLMRYKVPA